MSVLQRDLDAYQRALEAYRRRYGSAVREQNAAIQNLQSGQQYLVPTETAGQYLIATGVDPYGEFSFKTERTGGFLGMGRQTVPVTVSDEPPGGVMGSVYEMAGEITGQPVPKSATERTGIPLLPTGPTPDAVGAAPVAPDASLAQARAAGRPSLAQAEAGLIGQVMRGKGVRQGGVWYPPTALASEMAERAEEKRLQDEADRRRAIEEQNATQVANGTTYGDGA